MARVRREFTPGEWQKHPRSYTNIAAPIEGELTLIGGFNQLRIGSESEAIANVILSTHAPKFLAVLDEIGTLAADKGTPPSARLAAIQKLAQAAVDAFDVESRDTLAEIEACNRRNYEPKESSNVNRG